MALQEQTYLQLKRVEMMIKKKFTFLCSTTNVCALIYQGGHDFHYRDGGNIWGGGSAGPVLKHV